jgi:hypothetical protein
MLLIVTLAGLPTLRVHGAASAAIYLHLQRATFDPLQSTPSLAAHLQANDDSRLLIVQFDRPPDAETQPTLAAAGLRPLLFIPDHAFLVRVLDSKDTAVARLRGLRWSGAFELAYKLPPELDTLLSGDNNSSLDLRLLVAHDADVDALVRDITALGGAISDRSTGLIGATLRLHLPAAKLRDVLVHDDVLWIEPFIAPQLFNDQAREIMGVPAVVEQLGLSGDGQVIALTDSGLDRQSRLSADFAGRVAAAFAPSDMSSACSRTNWDDFDGHGTHVAGTALGSGALAANNTYAGVAPQAQLVIQAVINSPDSESLDCLTEDAAFLPKAYDAGARVQNASWGGPTGGSPRRYEYGGYTAWDQTIDSFLWNHKDHLLVAAAGNEGQDRDRNGMIDRDSINSPGTAKNVLTVGATENNRRPTVSTCSSSASAAPENRCWSVYVGPGAPFDSDFVSDNPGGMAAFSSRGPTDDGRIKPEIVAPGVNVISARSHAQGASYQNTVDANYAYGSGTSMATPMVSGMAALARQWLQNQRGMQTPSAALIKALLLNGATNIGPGQYGTASQQEVPDAWPNSVAGWGRGSLPDTIGLGGDKRIWLKEDPDGLQTSDEASYSLNISAGQPLRVTLAWTDYPGAPLAGKALVNDLDLEVQAPDGTTLRGNTTAELSSGCRSSGADRCNNVESVEIASPGAGNYTLRVRGAAVAQGPQPFALVARAQSIGVQVPAATILHPINNGGSAALALVWDAVSGATHYEVQESSTSDFTSIKATFPTANTSITLIEDIGTYYFRVRACNEGGCGTSSNTQSATVRTPPEKQFLPTISR